MSTHVSSFVVVNTRGLLSIMSTLHLSTLSPVCDINTPVVGFLENGYADKLRYLSDVILIGLIGLMPCFVGVLVTGQERYKAIHDQVIANIL